MTWLQKAILISYIQYVILELMKIRHLTVLSNNFNINIRSFKVDQLLKI